MTEQQVVYLTAEGKAELEAKLEFLRTTRRREVAERIRGAKDDGDISESGEYEDAKREQAFLEGEIRSIEQTLRHGRVIENNGATETVSVGRTVTVRPSDGDEDESWRIVSPAESNPRQHKISTASPIGAALIGRKVGEVVQIETLNGHMEMKILKVD
jgi:transcription elongation factor GreA